jgi:serine/threonine-protein kinase
MTPPPGSHSWDELAELYERARTLEGAERLGLLETACADRPALRVELEAMLAAAASGETLELEALAGIRPPEATPPGTRLGPWRLLRLIAHGGMGEVHLAERVGGGFAQQVAIKLLRTPWPTSELLDRFRLERDLLARLTHPSVVPLLDGGTAPDGRPYLVLQYVDGAPITDYCTAAGLDLAARLRLFVALCRAVQYAHSNLVVHRDLKPSNILVTADGEIRLLDFGIAKLLATAPDGPELTEAAPAPMTPGRAAPEQRRGGVVSTATDVWALGVLLHELVTGEPPADLEADPVRLAPTLADRDLAAIAGAALRADPDRRYPSAGQLGDDVERWLAGQPVSARPDSFGYRAARFVARHRVAVAAGAVAAAALVLLAGAATVQSLRAREESRRATAEAEKASAVIDLLIGILGGLDPMDGAAGDTVRIDDLLARGEERARALVEQPEVRAAVRHALGKILLERGDYIRARATLGETLAAEAARLGAAAPELVELRLDQARALHMTGDLAGALTEVRAAGESLAAGRPRPALQARVFQELGVLTPGAAGEAQLRQAIELQRQLPGADPLSLGSALVALAMRLRGRDDAQARALFAEALALERPVLGDDHPTTLSLRSNLALLLVDPDEREREHRAILAARVRRLGERHPYVGNSWNYLGVALAELGRYDEAEQAFSRAREIWVARAGPATGQALFALRHLARVAARRGRGEEAARLYADLLELLPAARIDRRTADDYRAEALAFAEAAPPA